MCCFHLGSGNDAASGTERGFHSSPAPHPQGLSFHLTFRSSPEESWVKQVETTEDRASGREPNSETGGEGVPVSMQPLGRLPAPRSCISNYITSA